MSITRVVLTGLLVFAVMLARVVAVAGGEPSGEQEPGSPPFSETAGGVFQVSPDSGACDRYQPAVAYNSGHAEYLVVWHNTWPDGSRDVAARRVSNTGQVLSWFTVTTGATDRAYPSVAYNAADDQYLVVWMQEVSSDVYEIWGRVIPWDGPGTNADFPIMTWGNRSFWTPRVAWGSLWDEYLVVWNAYDTTVSFPPGAPHDVAGHRVSAGGVVQNPGAPIIITEAFVPGQVDVVYNLAMSEYFVVWARTSSSYEICGARLSWDGSVVTPPGVVSVYSSTTEPMKLPAVASNNFDRYMVVWEREYNGGDRDILGREYDASGSPVGDVISLAEWTEDSTSPDVAAGINHEWLAVWEEANDGVPGSVVKGRSWDHGGVTHTFALAAQESWWYETPAVAAELPGYLMVFEGGSSSTYRHIYGLPWTPETPLFADDFEEGDTGAWSATVP